MTASDRVCPTCGEAFDPKRNGVRGGRPLTYCRKACRPSWGGVHARRGLLERTYGLTEAAYDALWAVQGAVCAICRSAPGPTMPRPAVDHDHATGLVRGLLCTPCNLQLGLYERYQQTESNPGWHRRNGIVLLAYLASPPAARTERID